VSLDPDLSGAKYDEIVSRVTTAASSVRALSVDEEQQLREAIG
jgi:outer membrane murein-binding lipoprotein Lpp